MARGSIYRRTLKAGRPSKYHAVIDVRTTSGIRKQITRSFDTRRDAEAWLAAMASERQERSAGPTLAEYLPQWLDGKVGVKPSTRASYRAHVERYLVPRLGGIALRQLTPQQVACWHKDLMEAGVEPPTLARIHATLSSALATARRQGLIDRNPLDGVELPRRRPYRRTTWTQQEAAAFLSGVRGDPLEGLWRLALLSGLRRGELLGLRWSDIDLTSGTATVDTTRLRLGGDIIEDGPCWTPPWMVMRGVFGVAGCDDVPCPRSLRPRVTVAMTPIHA